MKSDLSPLRDPSSGSSDLERTVLSDLSFSDPPSGAQDRVWASIVAQLPGPPSGGAGSGGPAAGGGGPGLGGAGGVSAATATGGALGVVKATAIGSVLGFVIMGGYTALDARKGRSPAVAATESSVGNGLEQRSPTSGAAVDVSAPERPAHVPPPVPSPKASASPARAVSSPADDVGGNLAPPNTVGVPGRSVATFGSVPATQGVSALREESRMLRQARAALRAGDARAALGLLARSRQRHPASELSQEREALTIEALWWDGSREAASDRARKFLATYPSSPHASAVRRFAK